MLQRIGRRMFLKGCGGVMVALPLLERFEGKAWGAAAPPFAKRVIAMTYNMGIPNGEWMPSAAGSSFTLPYVTAPLEPFRDRVTFISGLGAVSAIGAGINATYANVRAGLSVLRRAEIPCSGISTSSFRITWMVPDADVARAARSLHAHFIESGAPRVP